MREKHGRGRGRLLLAGALMASALGFQGAGAHPSPLDHLHGGPTHFVEVRDGTSIAITICYPDGFDPNNTYDPQTGTGGYPTIFEMAGYENGSVGTDGSTINGNGSKCTGRTTTGQLRDWWDEQPPPDAPQDPPLAGDSHDGTSAHHYDHGSNPYVVVHASVRGTGCSGGEFDLFSSVSSEDGYDVIENFIATQPWSNRKVGIIGHSYSGITGTLIAGTRPPHLSAISVSGLIDDVYRGITYPGGIFNQLFPVEWTLGIRPAYDVLGGSAQGVVRNAVGNPAIAQKCLENVATHRRTVTQDPIVHGLNEFDDDWFRSRSLIRIVDRINVPIHMTGAFQDEQTGPRFPHLFEAVSSGVPKRLLMMNGNHGTQVSSFAWPDRKAWMDYWMQGLGTAFPQSSVKIWLQLNTTGGPLQESGVKESTAFPLPDTDWTAYYLGQDAGGNGTLSTTGPGNGTASYVSGTKRQSWSFEAPDPTLGSPATTVHLPDELEFRGPELASGADPVPIAGPITANLFVNTTGIDTELFVQLIDEDVANDKLFILQRGLLRGSHRAIDFARSDYHAGHADPHTGAANFLYRPHRPHSNAQYLLDPTAVEEYLVEIFPVAHVLRPGHRLMIKIMAPPAVDSQYSYQSRTAGVNTVHFSTARPSRITLPVIQGVPSVPGPAPQCGTYYQVRCVSS